MAEKRDFRLEIANIENATNFVRDLLKQYGCCTSRDIVQAELFTEETMVYWAKAAAENDTFQIELQKRFKTIAISLSYRGAPSNPLARSDEDEDDEFRFIGQNILIGLSTVAYSYENGCNVVTFTLKEKELQNLEKLWEATNLLQTAHNLEEVLDNALTQAMRAVNAESGTIWLSDEDGEYIYPYLMHGSNISGMKGLKQKIGDGVAGWVTQNSQSQIIMDTSLDPRWTVWFDSRTGYVTRSMICVPLVTANSCIGSLQLLNKQDDTLFDDNDLSLCENLATLIAIAVEQRGLAIREPAKQEVLIHLDRVTRTYQMGEVLVEALRGVTIDIYKGELLVILGASGCGKSTLLNILGGMDQVSSGRIVVNKRDISNANEKELTNYRKDEIGFVFQFYNLIPDLTAGENIALAAELAQDPLSVDDVLKEVGLIHKKNHFPSQMSGGEQQRISIARAIVKRPQILLCDEPTGALDYQTGKKILVLLEKIARNTGSNVIIVTHNSAFGAMADRVIKMRSGQLIEAIKNPFPVPAEEIEW